MPHDRVTWLISNRIYAISEVLFLLNFFKFTYTQQRQFGGGDETPNYMSTSSLEYSNYMFQITFLRTLSLLEVTVKR